MGQGRGEGEPLSLPWINRAHLGGASQPSAFGPEGVELPLSSVSWWA